MFYRRCHGYQKKDCNHYLSDVHNSHQTYPQGSGWVRVNIEVIKSLKMFRESINIHFQVEADLDAFSFNQDNFV